MTSSDYVTMLTGAAMYLVDEVAGSENEATLATNEYFALMIYVESETYLRNYIEYKGKSNYNDDLEVYDIDLAKQGIEAGFYITKHYDRIVDNRRGRVIIVNVTDLSKCILLN